MAILHCLHILKRKPTKSDKNRYQTIYSSEIGSTAAPTAGLHFDEKVFSKNEMIKV